MFTNVNIRHFLDRPTPFYVYDMKLLGKTMSVMLREASRYDYDIQYTVKANMNPEVLAMINRYGLDANCHAYSEINESVKYGFKPLNIIFSGPGKTDDSISKAIDIGVSCFYCESFEEVKVINDIASEKGVVVPISLRVNPQIEHETDECYISKHGLDQFGIVLKEITEEELAVLRLPHIKFMGLKFNIGSQIISLNVFRNLCEEINLIQDWFESKGFHCATMNLGGSLGINYTEPDRNGIPFFECYFETFYHYYKRREKQKVMFEFGRSIVGQCGSLITRVLYVKQSHKTNYAVMDAGIFELLRPAFYGFKHLVQHLSPGNEEAIYTLVGPSGDLADIVGRNITLPILSRNDIIAVRSCGAYGEVMARAGTHSSLKQAVYYFGDEHI